MSRTSSHKNATPRHLRALERDLRNLQDVQRPDGSQVVAARQELSELQNQHHQLNHRAPKCAQNGRIPDISIDTSYTNPYVYPSTSAQVAPHYASFQTVSHAPHDDKHHLSASVSPPFSAMYTCALTPPDEEKPKNPTRSRREDNNTADLLETVWKSLLDDAKETSFALPSTRRQDLETNECRKHVRRRPHFCDSAEEHPIHQYSKSLQCNSRSRSTVASHTLPLSVQGNRYPSRSGVTMSKSPSSHVQTDLHSQETNLSRRHSPLAIQQTVAIVTSSQRPTPVDLTSTMVSLPGVPAAPLSAPMLPTGSVRPERQSGATLPYHWSQFDDHSLSELTRESISSSFTSSDVFTPSSSASSTVWASRSDEEVSAAAAGHAFHKPQLDEVVALHLMQRLTLDERTRLSGRWNDVHCGLWSEQDEVYTQYGIAM